MSYELYSDRYRNMNEGVHGMHEALGDWIGLNRESLLTLMHHDA